MPDPPALPPAHTLEAPFAPPPALSSISATDDGSTLTSRGEYNGAIFVMAATRLSPLL